MILQDITVDGKRKPKQKHPRARRCEFCAEVLVGRKCQKCQKRVAGYYPDPEKMPPKENKAAWIELGKSCNRMIELTRKTTPKVPKKKVLHTVICYACGLEAEVNAWMAKSRMPHCGAAECKRRVKNIQNSTSHRKMNEKKRKKVAGVDVKAGYVGHKRRDKKP